MSAPTTEQPPRASTPLETARQLREEALADLLQVASEYPHVEEWERRLRVAMRTLGQAADLEDWLEREEV